MARSAVAGAVMAVEEVVGGEPVDTLILGIAIWLSAAGVAPAPSPSSTQTVPTATTLTLREAVTRASVRNSAPLVLHQRQPARVSRFSRSDRINAVVAGVCGGWMAGGAIGWIATSKPQDDVSGLRGVMIGAPVGAVVGAVVAYRLTK